jgi:hypothetical protein
MEIIICSSLDAFRVGSAKQIAVQEIVQTQMEEKLGNNEDLKKAIIPKFAVGCQRLLPRQATR